MIQRHTGPDERCGRLAPTPGRHDELRLLDEVWGTKGQYPPLAQTLAYDRHVVLLEIANSSVDELRGRAARARTEVGALDQGHSQSTRRRLTRHAHPGDAATDHHHVERLAEAVDRATQGR